MVQDEVLAKNPSVEMRVYVIWFSMLPGDSHSELERAETFIPDQRALHFWDEDKIVGRAFARQYGAEFDYIVWDAYFLYAPDTRWDASPPVVASKGATVIATINDLQASLALFLEN